MEERIIDFDTMMDDIREALIGCDEKYISALYNRVCSGIAEYKGDSLWKIT